MIDVQSRNADGLKEPSDEIIAVINKVESW